MQGRKGLGCSLSLLFGIGMVLFMAYIFGFSIKGTDEYACAMRQVRGSDLVEREVGTPIEPGVFAITYSRETGGAQASATFATSISGPLGRGKIRVDSYRAPVGAYLLVQFKGNEDWVDVYSGSYPCR